MSSTSGRVFSDEEWAEIVESWEIDYQNIVKTLKLVSGSYAQRNWKRKGLDEVIIREKYRQKLLMMLIDVIRKVDYTLHPN